MSLAVRRGVLPGFRLTLGITLAFIAMFLAIPLAVLVVRGASLPLDRFIAAITSARAVAAFRVSVITAVAAALLNTLFGLVVAWVLERYSFPFRRTIDMLIDIPFALPTAVAGITLASLYGPNGAIGRFLEPHGVKIAYTPAGIVVALMFVTLPFAVRPLQPVIRDLDADIQSAAESLGASPFTTFRRVILPELRHAIATAFTLSLARAIGEYGSVIFIAGNMPLKTETVPLLIMIHLDQFEYDTAVAIAITYLVAGVALLVVAQILAARGEMRRLS